MNTVTRSLRRGRTALPRCSLNFSSVIGSSKSQNRLFASASNHEKHRPDPMARRPTAKCDPFGQGGKPLVLEDAIRLSATVDSAWKVETEMKETKEGNQLEHPATIVREFQHPDFMSAASFFQEVAAVAQMNDHFPSLTMERKLNSRKKMWTIVSSVRCHTKVLGGLSHHDFFLATLIDVEIERPEVKSLLMSDSDSQQ
ncbi:unnamed protein product [Cylindrotheca closterium]|uniref:4a-hydroxytetrahydrobiopterin dehydratase n=1 Tax=Cylindrotheca closterium TaxID=2856 RepID=A0AAD2JMN3_9STRA|nr:unnamed protein product [Cylindrotheca closterium]